MGIFDFFRKKTFEPKVLEETLTQEQTEETPNEPEAVETVVEVEANKDCVPEVKKKRILKDFFEIDILSLKPNEGETRIVLEEPLMGMFHYVEFHYTSDSTINLEFIALGKRFSKQVIDFVESCTNTFGPTKQGEGVIVQKDHKFLLMGVFSRMWNNVWLECSTDSDTGLKALCLTLFNVEKTANFIME